MLTISALTGFALTILALSLKPGPGMVATITRAARGGNPSYFAYMAGVVLIEIFFLAIVVLGFAIAEDHILFIGLLVKSLAACWLIYIGFNTLVKPLPDFDFAKSKRKIADLRDDFSTGVIVTLSNPITIVIFGGIIPTVIPIADIGIQDFLILSLIVVIIEVGVCYCYALPIILSRKFFSPASMDKMRIISGIALILVGFFVGGSALGGKDLLSVLG